MVHDAPLQVSDGLVAAVDRQHSLMEDLKQPGRRQAAETMAIKVQRYLPPDTA
jgi:hypothetical protein